MPKGVYDRSKAKPRGWWKDHGGPAAAQRERTARKKGQASTFKVPAPKAKPKKHEAGGKSLMRTVQPTPQVEEQAMSAVNDFAVSKLVAPQTLPADALVRIVDGLRPHHLAELDQAIEENDRRGDALKLLRDVVAVKCGKPAVVPPSPAPVAEKPKRPYKRKPAAAPADTEGGRHPSPSDKFRVPAPEDAEIPYNVKNETIPGADKPVSEAQLKTIEEKRKMVVELLLEEGNRPMRPMFIMGECAIGGNVWKRIINHPWFFEGNDGYQLSQLGQAVHVLAEAPEPLATTEERAERA